MLEDIGAGFTKGRWLFYKDIGKLPKALTNRFEVRNKNMVLIGYVKWYGAFRKYVFFAIDVILDDSCLTEIAAFCKMQTDKWREKQPKPDPRKFRHTQEYRDKLKKKMEQLKLPVGEY